MQGKTVYVVIMEKENAPMEVEVYASELDAQERLLKIKEERKDVLHEYDDMIEFENCDVVKIVKTIIK